VKDVFVFFIFGYIQFVRKMNKRIIKKAEKYNGK